MLNRKISGGLLAIVVLAITTFAVAKESNKWRIEFSEGAKSDGEIVFEFSPVGASSFEISISVEDGTGENAVARRVAEVLGEELPEDKYHVEVDDGEDVLVKKRRGVENFGIRLISNSVKAVRINLDRE